MPLHVPGSLDALLSLLGPCFTQPTLQTFRALLVGFVGRVGERTVTGMLQAARLGGVWHHLRAHDFFARARWCPDEIGLRLLDFLVSVFVDRDGPLLLAVDGSIFARSGRKVHGAVWHHDAHAAGGARARYGNCWVVVGLVVRIPRVGDRTCCLPVLFRLWLPTSQAGRQGRGPRAAAIAAAARRAADRAGRRALSAAARRGGRRRGVRRQGAGGPARARHRDVPAARQRRSTHPRRHAPGGAAGRASRASGSAAHASSRRRRPASGARSTSPDAGGRRCWSSQGCGTQCSDHDRSRSCSRATPTTATDTRSRSSPPTPTRRPSSFYAATPSAGRSGPASRTPSTSSASARPATAPAAPSSAPSRSACSAIPSPPPGTRCTPTSPPAAPPRPGYAAKQDPSTLDMLVGLRREIIRTQFHAQAARRATTTNSPNQRPNAPRAPHRADSSGRCNTST